MFIIFGSLVTIEMKAAHGMCVSVSHKTHASMEIKLKLAEFAPIEIQRH